MNKLVFLSTWKLKLYKLVQNSQKWAVISNFPSPSLYLNLKFIPPAPHSIDTIHFRPLSIKWLLFETVQSFIFTIFTFLSSSLEDSSRWCWYSLMLESSEGKLPIEIKEGVLWFDCLLIFAKQIGKILVVKTLLPSIPSFTKSINCKMWPMYFRYEKFKGDALGRNFFQCWSIWRNSTLLKLSQFC